MADSNKKVGYIYKIYDNTNANVYYGSTTQPLSKRMTYHRNNYRRNLKGMAPSYSAFKILENNNYSYNVVEKVEFEDKFELYTRERFYIENNECVNKVIPTRTTKEYREDNKEEIAVKKKQYREDNKEEIAVQRKQYREDNKEEILVRNKQYREDNKDKIAIKKKEK